jgi:hypothetical protein
MPAVVNSVDYEADVSASVQDTQVTPEPLAVKQERGLKRKAQDDPSGSSRRLRSHASQELPSSASTQKPRRQKKLRRTQSQSQANDTPKPSKNRRLKSTRSLTTPVRHPLEEVDGDCIYILPTPPEKREERTSPGKNRSSQTTTPTKKSARANVDVGRPAMTVEVVIPVATAANASVGKSGNAVGAVSWYTH